MAEIAAGHPGCVDAEEGCATAGATRKRPRVVVGLDLDVRRSGGALRWAAAEAVARDAQLSVVRPAADPRWDDARARAVSDARDEWPSASIDMVSTHIDGPHALLAEAVGADLLVVSALNCGAGLRRSSGSIRSSIAQRTSCPIVVVRDSHPHPISRIAVGIDNSNASAAALDWAIAEANLHQAEIVVVHAWEQHTRHHGSLRSKDLAGADARCVVDLAVRRCEDHTSRPVSGVAINGDPIAALVGVGRGVDIIVVGSRGRSGFTTLLFGSVALSVADQASCPVAVIHPRLRVSSL